MIVGLWGPESTQSQGTAAPGGGTWELTALTQPSCLLGVGLEGSPWTPLQGWESAG